MSVPVVVSCGCRVIRRSSRKGGMANREQEVVSLVERLVLHYSSGSQAAASVKGRTGYYLRVLSGSLFLSDQVRDEFATLHQAKRKLVRSQSASGQERIEALCSKLEVLHRRLQSSALAPLLTRRWAVLHTLVALANTTSAVNDSTEFLAGRTSTDFWADRTLISASGLHDTMRPRSDSQSHGVKPQVSGRASFVRHPQDRPDVAVRSGEEVELLRDLLFVFQGINGHSIRYDGASETHSLDPQLAISPAVKDEILRLSELGWLFRRVQAFVETANAHVEHAEMGLVGQAFCCVLQEELTEYYRLVSILESQLRREDEEAALNSPSNAGSWTTPHMSNAGGLTIKRLAVWVEEPLEKMRVLATLCDSLSVVRGGAIASVLYSHTKQGDPLARSLVERITARVSLPIFDMVRSWILEGELTDRHSEFFVEVLLPELSDTDERLWQHKYALRPAMLPRFISTELALKILVIGKSINFMRRSCQDKEWISSELSTVMTTEDLCYENVSKLQQVVDAIAQVVNKRLLELLMGRYQLMTHLQALKKFMTLGQGDFVTCLMDMIGPDLGKRCDQVYRHDLTGKLEAALRSSNAQFEQADILNRVGVRLLEGSDGEEGWEVFSLDYQVEAPVSAIIHSEASTSYSRMFHLLWRVKRVEWHLAMSWKLHMSVGHHRIQVPMFGSILHRCNLARGQMVHFVSNLSNFIMFAVLEASWTELHRSLVEEAKDLDGIIKAHDNYLATILDKAFLSEDKYILHSALQAVLKMILTFCNLHYNLCDAIEKDLNRRKEFARMIEERSAAGQWGLSREEQEAVDAASMAIVDQYQHSVDATATEYAQAFRRLIGLLQQQEGKSDAVNFLLFTLDFNHCHQRS